MVGSNATKTMAAPSSLDAIAPTDILGRHVAYSRQALLAALRDELAAQHINAVLVTRHRLVLRGKGPCDPSGLTDPQLYIFTSWGREVATTDGRMYYFADGQSHAVGDPAGAASRLAGAALPG
jgi:hypothetical protein